MRWQPEDRQTRPRRGFTLVELLVAVAVIAILLGILLPSLGAARRAAKQMRCAVNLREIGHAVAIYTDTHNGWLPTAEAAHHGDPGPANWWENQDLLFTLGLEPLPRDRSVLVCPADPRPDSYINGSSKPCWSSFAANASCFGMRRGGSKRGRCYSQVAQPAEALAFCDAQFSEGEALVVGHQGCVVHAFAYRHQGCAEAVFLDGHVEPITPSDIPVDSDELEAWQYPFWGNIPQFW
ncbi:MAG: type II secretion system protein [Planctomycetota bacterium]